MSSSSTGKPMILTPRVRKGLRNLRRFALPALAIVHLLSFDAVRATGHWTARLPAWPVSALVVLGCVLARDFLTARRKDRLPDTGGALAWWGAACLEAEAVSQALAVSRLVPATFFPLAGYLLAPLAALAYVLTAAGWLLIRAAAAGQALGWSAGIVGMALLGLAAGQTVRRRFVKARSRADEVREAIDRSRALVLPWESLEPGRERDLHGLLEDEGLLRWRADLEEGIRRVLEGLLPMADADGIVYATSPASPGRPFAPGPSVFAGPCGDLLRDLEIPDAFPPLREALVFRRSFFADGEGAVLWPLTGKARRLRLTGVAAAPVVVGENAEGAILALRLRDERWSEPVVPVLEMGAFFIAREYENARGSYCRARYLARQEGFHLVVRRIAEVAETGRVGDPGGEDPGAAGARTAFCREVVEQVRKLLRLDRVLLVEADGGARRGRIAWERSGDVSTGSDACVPLGETYVGWVLKNNVQRIFTGVGSAPVKYPILPGAWTRCEEQAFMLVPASGDRGFRGVLVCASKEDRSFDASDAAAVADILKVMRLGLSHIHRMEALEKEAERDGLTGLYNQKAFRRILSRIIGRQGDRYPCAVLMLDIDYFKKINDIYGHPAGDEILRRIAGVILKTIRKADVAGRYGGEEFVVCLPMADLEKATLFAERLLLMIRQTRFLLDGKEVRVTASMGIAASPAHGRTAEELLKLADEALYSSKQGGRNRVTIYETTNR
jgi:diguanylate cyclase (GGDEF)-like protein